VTPDWRIHAALKRLRGDAWARLTNLAGDLSPDDRALVVLEMAFEMGTRPKEATTP
jgi:hypothetical protein